MKKWEKFEIEAVEYLNEKIDKPISFKRLGSSNSSDPDIKVYLNDNEIFTIEVKFANAQSGQLVVFETENGLEISKETVKNINNKFNQSILNLFNETPEECIPDNQKKLYIELPPEIGYGWLRENYKIGNSVFIIMSDQLNAYKSIFHIDEIEEYLDFKCAIRRKKSGTRNLAQKNLQHSKLNLEKHAEQLGLKVIDICREGVKTRVELNSQCILKKGQRYFGDGYYLSPVRDSVSEYFIKSLSKTNNLNILFEITYKGPKRDNGIEKLKNYIDEYY